MKTNSFKKKPLKINWNLYIALCSFIPSYENIDTFHPQEYVARLQKQTLNTDEKSNENWRENGFEAVKTNIVPFMKINDVIYDL